jgi:hypothetical protein
MRLTLSALNKKNVAYFGDADYLNQLVSRSRLQSINLKLNLSILLYDHVILAAAYYWQSPLSYRLLLRNEEFIRSGDLLPVIRKPTETRDFGEYFDRRYEEMSSLERVAENSSNKLWSEVPRLEQRKLAQDLDKLNVILYNDGKSVEQVYREIWLNDVKENQNPDSLYNILNSSSNTYVNKYLGQLESMALIRSFSRAHVANHIMGFPIASQMRKAMIYRASDLYLSANAIASNTRLISENLLTLTYRGNNVSYGELALDNPLLFGKVLSICGISSKLISRLTPTEILILKQSAELQEFKNVYFKFLSQAIIDKDELEETLTQEFTRRKRSDILKNSFKNSLQFLNWGASTLFAAALGALLQEVNQPLILVTAGSGVFAGLSYIVKRLDWLNKTPVWNMNRYALNHEFKNRLHSAIPDQRY